RGEPVYALEGSVFIAGAAIQWLRDGLGLIERAADTERLARDVPDTGGVYFVPAFVGLGAPHWEPNARGTIAGISRGTGRAHLAPRRFTRFLPGPNARAVRAREAEWRRAVETTLHWAAAGRHARW